MEAEGWLSIHIGAKQGEIASTVLLPGDPLRARHIAQTMLEGAVCFNEVRGMLGYTGTCRGKRISVMGSGMGIPSLSIYAHELVAEYRVKTLIRVGTCGAIQADLKIGDIVLALTASTDSQTNKLRFNGMDFAPAPSFELLLKAYKAARESGIQVRVGGVLSGDIFYNDDPDWWKVWAEHSILACDMETSGLYTLAARLKVEALAVLTVSDNIVTKAAGNAEQREQGFTQMARIALEIAE